jgi:hypothetical protein
MRTTSDLKIFYPGKKLPVLFHRAELFPSDEILFHERVNTILGADTQRGMAGFLPRPVLHAGCNVVSPAAFSRKCACIP